MNKNRVPINWQVLSDAAEGDAAAMKELAAIYLHQGVKTLRKLRSAVQNIKPGKVVDAAHRFLGSSRFFGATEIGKPLAALVKKGRSGRLGPTAVQLVDQTEKEFVRIKQFFKSLGKKKPGSVRDA